MFLTNNTQLIHKVFFTYGIVIMLLAINILQAQTLEQITFLNGNKISVWSLSIDSSFVHYSSKQSKKNKLRKISCEHVFSIRDNVGEETVIYVPKNEVDRSVNEMREFIQGQIDAKASKQSSSRAMWWFFSGVASGCVLGLVVQADMQMAPLPVALPVFAHFNGVNLQSYPLLGKSKDYIEGFEKEIRNKKVYRAFQGAIIGSLSGLIIMNSIR